MTNIIKTIVMSGHKPKMMLFLICLAVVIFAVGVVYIVLIGNILFGMFLVIFALGIGKGMDIIDDYQEIWGGEK